jgi:3-deoxy-D-manno-octulosonic-acid transferase
MRTKADAERIIALGVPEGRVRVVGNMKYDGVLAEWEKEDPSPLREIFKPRPGEKLFVFGNTREGEEALLIPAIKLFIEEGTVSVIIAPRHVERTGEVERLLNQAGISTALWSELAAGKERKPGEAILLDQMGRLFSLYGICAAAFIGGSLLPFGGQNILEPAVFGKPVLFGRHMDNFQEEARILKESGGGIEVRSPGEIYSLAMKLLENPEEAERVGKAAANAVAKQSGALEKCLKEFAC